MKLIECYITGFGRLKNKSYKFDEGITEFLEDNGWGKTTFSVFIKAMFFGMEYSRKSKLLERKHYLPWEKGTYGGSLTFSFEGKTYRIERTFGEKEKDDTFKLYDAVSGKESTDYSVNIGEEIFEVDRESFERSIFVPQESLSLEITDSLNAKMGGVADAQGDLKNFEAVIKRIEAATKVYTQNSKVNPGKLRQINAELSEAREQSEKIPSLLEAYETRMALAADKKEELSRLEEKKGEITQKITESGAKEQKLGEYKVIKQNLEKQQDTMTELGKYFKSGVPKSEELDEWDDRERDLEVNRSKRDELRSQQPDEHEISFLKDMFEDDPIDQATIDQWSDQAKKIQNLRMRGEHSQMTEEERGTLAELRNFFVKKEPTVDELKTQLSISSRGRELSGKLQSLEERYKDLREREDEIHADDEDSLKGFNTVLLVLLVLALLAGAVYFIKFPVRSWITIAVSITCILAAILIFVFGLLLVIIKKGRNTRDREQFEKSLSEAGEELARGRDEYDEILEANQSFLSDFPEIDAEDIQQSIIEIQRKMDRFQSLEEKEKEFLSSSSESMDELSSLQLELYTSLSHYTTILEINLYEDPKEEQVIKDISSYHQRYNDYLSRSREISRITAGINAEYDGLMAVINSFPVENNDSIPVCLKEIRQKYILYNETKKQIYELNTEVKQFETTHKLNTESDTLASLQEEQNRIEDEITGLRSVIAEDEKNLDDTLKTLQECEEMSERIDELLETKGEIEEKVRLYEATVNYLNEAKEEFLSEYMGPLQRSMRRYLKKIYDDRDSSILTNAISLDMNLGLLFRYQGITRSGEFMSVGYQDLAAFCGRLALVDILYPRQTPMIILDDPFTNFDEDKLEKVKELLSE
ncbi:MAG: AAA family ATPase, partial [Lachnospiraceae bacterium]|nr:AAA family ATPase [Lachnospiraceae bacterium]